MFEKNITLIGMPGCGKSTVGVVLAKMLCKTFIDSDLVIQHNEKKRLHKIIEEIGNEGFLKLENRTLATLCVHNSVIATGGSAVFGKEAMEHLKSIGTVVYLKISCEELAVRLGDLNERGVTLKPGQDLNGLYEERVPYYEKYADVTIECDDQMIKDIVAQIKSQVNM